MKSHSSLWMGLPALHRTGAHQLPDSQRDAPAREFSTAK
jgi:hypothetical protein